MDMSYLKELNSRMQIVTTIEKGSLFGGEVWQSSLENKSRYLSQISEIKNEINSGRVFFRTISQGQIDPAQPVYVRLNYRSLIFMLLPGEFRVHGDWVSCYYPKEARAMEERPGGPRFVLPRSADLSLSLKRMERTMRELTYEIELRIIDVSDRGFGIIITQHNRSYFRQNDYFWLKAVDHKPLRTPILGNVCYVSPKGPNLKHGEVRVGVSLSIPLQQDTLDRLKKKSIVILSA